MQESSIFIRVLRYGEEKGLSGFEEEEYRDWLKSEPEVESEDGVEFQRGYSLLHECFDNARFSTNDQLHNHFILKSEYYFRLIEFQELEESRKAARSANRNSLFAIGISVVAIFLSAYLSYIQTTTPMTIAESQANYLSEILEKNTIAQERQIKQQTRELVKILSSINDKLGAGTAASN